jgi:hypothetical protein
MLRIFVIVGISRWPSGYALIKRTFTADALAFPDRAIEPHQLVRAHTAQKPCSRDLASTDSRASPFNCFAVTLGQGSCAGSINLPPTLVRRGKCRVTARVEHNPWECDKAEEIMCPTAGRGVNVAMEALKADFGG